MDGCFLNTITLYEINKAHRERIETYTVMSLDLQNAFDTMRYGSLFRELKAFGVDEKEIEYVVVNCRVAIITVSKPADSMGPLGSFQIILDFR